MPPAAPPCVMTMCRVMPAPAAQSPVNSFTFKQIAKSRILKEQFAFKFICEFTKCAKCVNYYLQDLLLAPPPPQAFQPPLMWPRRSAQLLRPDPQLPPSQLKLLLPQVSLSHCYQSGVTFQSFCYSVKSYTQGSIHLVITHYAKRGEGGESWLFCRLI